MIKIVSYTFINLIKRVIKFQISICMYSPTPLLSIKISVNTSYFFSNNNITGDKNYWLYSIEWLTQFLTFLHTIFITWPLPIVLIFHNIHWKNKGHKWRYLYKSFKSKTQILNFLKTVFFQNILLKHKISPPSVSPHSVFSYIYGGSINIIRCFLNSISSQLITKQN